MTIRSTSRTHVLVTLGVLFTLGGATRLLFSNLAIAEEAAPTEAPENQEQATSVADPEAFTAVAEADQFCFTGETASLLIEDQTLFETQEEALKQDQLSLAAWQQELERQTAELQALKRTLDARWQEMQVAADEDMRHLAQMYGAMKADEAALIFDQMDPGFAAGFLRLLPSDQAGQIMAGMETDKAYVVSVELATMNHDIRTAAATN